MVDYFGISALLTREERSVRDTACKFVRSEVRPHIGDIWERGEFPREWIQRLGELGFLGMTLPCRYGTMEAGAVTYGLVMQELEAGDSGLRSFASVQSALVMFPIFEFGSKEQKARWLPRLARGEAVGCFGLTEPGAGSDPDAMTSRARKRGGDWVLSGHKRWTTNATIADIAVIWAKDEDDHVRGFLVPTDTPGFRAIPIRGKASMRASVSAEVFLEDMRLPEEATLPGASGLQAPLECLTEARFGIVWGAVGAASACYNEALEYGRGRVAFGKPIAGFQIIQERLVDMVTEITKAQLLAYHLGRLKERDKMHYTQVSLAKRNNVRMALKVAREARQILGASGILLDRQAMRHAANLESVDTYEGTYDIHTLVVGRDITGFSAFS